MATKMILIHGAWLSSESWENYVDFFTKAGYDVSAPEWPRKHDGVEAQRDRGLGQAGVAIDPASPKGVLRIYPSTLKAAGPALNHPSTRKGTVALTAEQFNYGFTNTFTPEAAAAAYEKYPVPETGRIFFEGGFANFKKYKHSESRTDYLEFAGRSHFHMVQDGWEEIAGAIGSWLGEVGTGPT